MNTKTIMGTFVIFTMVLTTLLTATTVDAKQNNNGNGNGNSNGHYKSLSFPGNSFFGRMHNPNFEYKYQWGTQNFENFDDLIERMREMLNTWREDHGTYDSCNQDTTQVSVVTRSATTIDTDSATLRGKVNLDEGEVATVWFEYGTESSDLSSDTTSMELEYGDTAYFSKTISDLDSNTRYYFRSVAENEDNVVYGSTFNFVTDTTDTADETPYVSTRVPSNVTDDSVTLRGRVEMRDFDNGIVFFVYGTDEDTIDDVDNDFDTYEDIEDTSSDSLKKVQIEDELDGNASYVHDIEDLDNETVYHYRIGVQYENTDGEDVLKLGGVRTFITE